ncbi:alkyl hydroperoxide reductase subunit F [Halobacteriovorax sp. GB3]|uniref:alkyl hydroperoxide reductase subunit F n=1 Tax=Halobacteriovorax sp. GB3 TaxID=2719615 RepID=UPI002361750C|nr:alkyl hydroperoxide reductase subunit F [Halobacteriovorax sp. GB3]MDD0851730.1 alkyl hydroperoxide reductase subunit F [Halobacteriovorax sp. GB3]
MLDSAIIEQLKSVFGAIDKKIELVAYKSEDQKQGELEQMLEQIASTSDLIDYVQLEDASAIPRFYLTHDGKENGIRFAGIPGGHEFTSLILAILNSNGKGKLPDEQILTRIKNLKGPIDLKTYISLSCENCPEVVQALNIMSVYNDSFTHEMIDGAFAEDEIQRLKIQGVPSVIAEDKLFSSGKTTLIELLKKLEDQYGKEESAPVNKDLGEFDVVVVGGGPAGASSAIYSARKGLKTVIIAEKMGGQVQDTKGIENLISVPYTEGPQLANQLATHIAEYDIKVLEHRRVQEIRNDNLKILELDSGEFLKTKALIVATGAKWRELGIPGEKEYIGRGVAFCPHCDGPYYKGKDIAVIGGGNSGVEAAIDLAGIVKSVTLFEFMPDLKADEVLVNKLKSLSNVTIISNARTSEVLGDGDKVVALEYEERESGEMKKVELDGVFVQIGLKPNSEFIKDVVEVNRFGEIVVDQKCRTNVKGIYAAGDVTTVPYKQIIIAMGEGAKASLTAFEDQMVSS